MKRTLITATGLALVLAGAPVTQANVDISPAIPDASGTEVSLAQFSPRPSDSDTSIDYSHWDEALGFFVVRMGKSIRQAAPSVEATLGSRRIYGHDSRYRLEGNRVAFSYLGDEQIAALTAYRADLEQVADSVDISALPRNEQLAYWMNLHNVAVVEQIALAYPVHQPSRVKLAGGGVGIDDAKAIIVSGVRMSPRDIRTKIVYPNWQDPKVIYGFFRGEIGGPSIQKEAFTAANVSTMLNSSGREFVNSLRGTQKRGRVMQVSKIYEEARPFYFADWDNGLRSHIAQYSAPAIQDILERTDTVRASIYERDISDLANGERSPIYTYVTSISGESLQVSGDRGFNPSNGQALRTGIPPSIIRLMKERSEKFEKMYRNDELVGRVTFIDTPNSATAGDGEEVK